MVERSISPPDPIALANPSVLGQLRSVEIQASLVIMGDDVLDWGHERRSMMKLLTLALQRVPIIVVRTPNV
jgi:hypothetical protein